MSVKSNNKMIELIKIGNSQLIVLDQIRTIDKTRLVKKLGRVDDSTQI